MRKERRQRIKCYGNLSLSLIALILGISIKHYPGINLNTIAKFQAFLACAGFAVKANASAFELGKLWKYRQIRGKAEVDLFGRQLEVLVNSRILQLSHLEAAKLPTAKPTAPQPEEPQAQIEAEESPFFDWDNFDKYPNKYPHIIEIGGTGDGKSYLAEYLAKKLSGLIIVSHPHRKPSDYVGIDSIHCGGRNYGDWKKDKAITFESLLNPCGQKISFASFIKTVNEEMDRRYKLYEQGIEDYPQVNIVLDELNTCLAKVPKSVDILKELIREARKVKIRLFCLLQSDSVKSMKIEGEGDIRECFRYVRLGGFAKAYAKKLHPAIKDWCDSVEYPILVEDCPAIA